MLHSWITVLLLYLLPSCGTSIKYILGERLTRSLDTFSQPLFGTVLNLSASTVPPTSFYLRRFSIISEYQTFCMCLFQAPDMSSAEDFPTFGTGVALKQTSVWGPKKF